MHPAICITASGMAYAARACGVARSWLRPHRYTRLYVTVLHLLRLLSLDVKPDNILVNHGQAREKYSKIVLSDNGDSVYLPSLPASEEGHIIGAHIFRSPEAMLNLKWGPATDIWSLGTTVCLSLSSAFSASLLIQPSRLQLISLMMGRGWHIFKPDPKIVKPDDETYPIHVFRRHDQFFGPFPHSFAELADAESLEILEWVINNCEIRTPFARAEDKEVSEEARTLICKMMMLDPRDRPSARSLLEDAWFADFRSTSVP